MTAMATHMMKKQIADLGVPEVPEFLEQIVASGGHLWACRMSADMMHLDEDDLYDEVEGIISAARLHREDRRRAAAVHLIHDLRPRAGAAARGWCRSPTARRS